VYRCKHNAKFGGLAPRLISCLSNLIGNGWRAYLYFYSLLAWNRTCQQFFNSGIDYLVRCYYSYSVGPVFTDGVIAHLGLVMSDAAHLPSVPYSAGSPGKLQPVPPLASVRQESATVSIFDARLLNDRDAGLDSVLGRRWTSKVRRVRHELHTHFCLGLLLVRSN
jgi:hypothetical protein